MVPGITAWASLMGGVSGIILPPTGMDEMVGGGQRRRLVQESNGGGGGRGAWLGPGMAVEQSELILHLS